MPADPESPYRHARRAFIAACEAAHVDPIARLNPAKAPDGKPLFMDCAALGPRLAARALLVVAEGPAGAALLTVLLKDSAPPARARLVLVHALDPAAFAGVAGDPAWPAAMLGAVATEDLPKVRDLAILALDGDGKRLEPMLQAALPRAAIRILPTATDIHLVRAALTDFFAAG